LSGHQQVQPTNLVKGAMPGQADPLAGSGLPPPRRAYDFSARLPSPCRARPGRGSLLRRRRPTPARSSGSSFITMI